MTKQPLPPITKIAERLLCDIEQAVRGFARYHKYSLGSDLRAQAMTVVRMCHRAWRERSRQAHWTNELVWSDLTLATVRAYAFLVAANSAHGIGVPDSQGRSGRRAFHVRGFFVGNRSARCYDGLGGGVFGLTGSLTRYANPVQSVTRGLASPCGGFQTQSRRPIMANTALNPSPTFQFHDHQVRAVIRDGEPWFVCADVAAALGYRDAANAARNLSAHQKADTQIVSTSSSGTEQARTVTLINESGLYRLVLRSRKPEAVAFSDWVTGEVLPAIRKTGRYDANPQHDLLDPSWLTEGRQKLLAWSDSIRAGNSVVFPELDESTIAGMVGFAISRARFLAAFDDKGRLHLTSIPHNACVMTQEQMLHAINEPNGLMVSTSTLAKFAAASAKRLAERIERAQS